MPHAHARPAEPPPGPTPPSPAESSAPSLPIRVFLAEDHAITLWGLLRLIEGRPQQLSVVGTAASCGALLAHPALPQAQVLVLDLDLDHQDSLEILPALQHCSLAKVLVLTASDDAQRHCRAIELGARGVLHKREAPQQILAAIAQVHSGAAWLNPQLMGQVLGRLNPRPTRTAPTPGPPQGVLVSLTARERDIVCALSRYPQAKLLTMASQLGMSENTLRNHLTTVYGKLGVRGRLELHVFAAHNGLTAD